MEDCIIIGAGAAGLFAAGAAVHAGKRVTVLEHMDAPGKKLLITGKGRCNVTNNCGPDEFLKNVRRNPRFLYSALNACPPAFVMELLEKGLELQRKCGAIRQGTEEALGEALTPREIEQFKAICRKMLAHLE